MTTTQSTARFRVGLAVVLAFAIGALAGCNPSTNSGSPSTQPKKPVNIKLAKEAAGVALSTLATEAPDAKILLGDTVAPVNATSTAMWEFLVGSEKKSMVYSVLVANQVGQFKQYGKIVLKHDEWAKVPSLSVWKVDSDAAVAKARVVYPQGQKAAYIAEFLTYRPASAPKTANKAMTWKITFNPSSNKSKLATTAVLVDMITGDAAFAK